MALSRKDKTVVKVKEVTADTDVISSIVINFDDKSISIALSHGNMLEGIFEKEFDEVITLRDTEDFEGTIEETLTVSNSSIELKVVPSSVGMRVENNGIFLFMGSGWTIDDKILTFVDLDDGEIINVRYTGLVSAVSDFSDVINVDVTKNESLYNNLEIILWNKLSELGTVDGDII